MSAENSLRTARRSGDGLPRLQDALNLDSEMRRATVMMVDIVGSTTMSEKLEPEDSFALLQEVLQIARAAVTRHGGTLMNEMGDGLFALFGAPVSIERASLAACRAGLDVLRDMRAGGETWRARFGMQPEVRVGLAAGEVLISGLGSERVPNATGQTVNMAARLQAEASPGSVVVAETVFAEAQGWASFRPLGERELRGFSTRQKIYELLDTDVDQATRRLGFARYGGDFVGRTAEIGQMQDWLAAENNTRPICLATGEAGIGKSRLLGEFSARIPDRRLIVGACHPAGTARPLGPIIDILREFLDFHPGLARDELSRRLDALLPATDDGRDALADVVEGLTRPGDEENPSKAIALRQALVTALLALGRRSEILVAVEDLHWIDPLSADVFLNVVAAATEDFRMFGTTRPAGWISDLPQHRFCLVHASPLAAVDIAQIAQSMTGQTIDPAFADQVARQSEGNPFFAIEILHSLAQVSMPDPGRIGAIQNVALARFDLLDGVTKALLRVASVLGRMFRLDVLQAAAEVSREEIDRMMLAAEGIVEPDPAAPATAFRFRHILFRDSIYATIPTAARKMAHRAAAEALQSRLPDRLEDFSEVLADHYEAAGDAVDAVRFLTMASHRAFGLYALQSCHALTDRAIRLLETSTEPFDRVAVEEVLSMHLRCLDLEDLFRDVVKVFEAWSSRLLTPESSAEQVLMMAITAKSKCHLQQFDDAHRLALQALEISDRVGDARATAYVKVVLMRILMDSRPGSFPRACQLFEETRAFTEAQSDGSLYAHRMFNMIAAFRTEGRLDKAIELNRTFLAFGETHRLAHVIAVSNWCMSHSMALARDHVAGLAHADVALKFAFGNRATTYIAKNQRNSNILAMRRPVPLAEIEEIRVLADTGGDMVSALGASLHLGYSMLISGRIADGWRQAHRSLLAFQQSGHIVARHYTLVMEAELRLALSGMMETTRERPKLGLRDALVLLQLRLTVLRKVKALMALVFDDVPDGTGHIIARAHVCLGLVAAKERRSAEAARHLDTAEAIFEQQGLASELALMAKWRALAGLGHPS